MTEQPKIKLVGPKKIKGTQDEDASETHIGFNNTSPLVNRWEPADLAENLNVSRIFSRKWFICRTLLEH